MRKIAGFLSILLLAGLSVVGQQGPSSNLRTFGITLDSLARDSTLTDSARAKMKAVSKVYKGLVQKLKDSIDVARKVTKATKADTVFVRIPDTAKKQAAGSEWRDRFIKRELVVISVDSVRVLMAAMRRDADTRGQVMLYAALLLIAVGGVGWGLWWARVGRAQRAMVVGPGKVLPVAKVSPLAEAGNDPAGGVPVGSVGEGNDAAGLTAVAAGSVAEAGVGVGGAAAGSVPVGSVAEGSEAAGLAAEARVEAKVVARGMQKGAFVCELMVTAGPRKKFMNEENADKDLGEDVCGCVVKGDVAAMWLLDGTSDQFCLRYPGTGREYFSSRLLAQDIGDRLREAFRAGGGAGRNAGGKTEAPDGWALDRMMKETIGAVRADWVKALRELPEDERLVLADNIRGQNCPECSSTLLSAVLSLDGMASAYRSGDSSLLMFRRGEDAVGSLIPSDVSFTTKNPKSNDRIFFRIVLDPAGDLDLLCNEPAYELVREERVRALIAFSDGIGAVTAEALKSEYGGNPGEVRRRTGSEIQGTADDKSICIISIAEP
jgi:hypothetical protein